MPKNKTLAKVLKFTLIIIAIIFLSALIRIRPNTLLVGYFAGECEGLCKGNFEITGDSIIVDQISTDSTTTPSVHKIIKGDFDSLKFRVPLLLAYDFRSSVARIARMAGAIMPGFVS